MIHRIEGAGNVELQSFLAGRLEAIDARIRDSIRDKLEVNRPKRVVPYYQFVPSHHHPEEWGVANLKASALKKSGKRRDNRRKGK